MSLPSRLATVSASSDLPTAPLVRTLRSYSDSSKLSILLREKLKPLSLRLDAEVTASCPFIHGLAVGLANGQVVLYLPPCSQAVQAFDHQEIQAIVCIEEHLIVFTQSGYVEVDSETKEQPKVKSLPAGEVSAAVKGEVSAAVKKEVSASVKGLGETDVLVGFAGGEVEAYEEEYGELKRKLEYQGGSGYVSKLYAIAGESWFVATFRGSDTLCCMWRYGQLAPRYRFSRSYEAIVVPDILVPEQNNQIPMNVYQLIVEKHRIAFIDTQEKNPFDFSFLVDIGKGASLDIANPSSKQIYVYYRAKAEGKAAFLHEDFATVLGPMAKDWLGPMIKKYEKEEKLGGNVFMADIEFEYEETVPSEDSHYLFLISRSEIRTFFLGAMETTYTHADSHNYSELSDSQVLHKRFSALHNSQGVLIKPLLANRSYCFSPDLNYLYTYSQDNTDWQLIRIQDELVRHQSQESPVVVFSQFDHSVILVYKASVKVLSLLPDAKDGEEFECKLMETTGPVAPQLYYRAEKWLFVFKPGMEAKAVKLESSPRPIELKVDIKFDKISEVDESNCDFVVGFKGKICYLYWTDSNLRETASYDIEYSAIRCFGQGRYLLGVSERRFHLFKLPSLQPIMTFGMDNRINLDPYFPPTFSTFNIDPDHPAYLSLTYWDLSVGIPTQTLDLGLALIPSISKSLDFSDRVPQYFPCIGRLWRYPKSLNCDKENASLSFYGAEYLPAYCYSLSRLSQLLSDPKVAVTPQLARLVISPCNVSVLHLLVHLGQSKQLAQALAMGAKFLKSCYGTPIGLILNSKEHASELDPCLDELLDGLTALSSAQPTAFLVAIHTLEEDFCTLLKCNSAYLPSFLQTILVPLPAEYVRTRKMITSAKLPLCDLWKDLQPQSPKWRLEKLWPFFHTYSPDLLICPIAFSMELEPGKLLDVLKDIDATKGILSQDVISFLAKAKWREVDIPMKLLSFLYWALLVLICCRIYDYGNEAGIQQGILALNSTLLLIEAWQCLTGGLINYFTNWWNYADFLRFGFTYAWIVVDKRLWLNFVIVCLNAFIGLTSFEAFDKTRRLVRMILKVCAFTFYFVLIFIYSNLSFGVLCAVSDESSSLNFYESWTTAFEISMGGFDNTGLPTLRWFVFFAAAIVNMVWLLNLIVALLGTAYQTFYNDLAAEDVKAQFELTYQMESMVKCLVSVKDRKRFLQVYREKQPAANPRDEGVTVQTLREELEELKKDVKALLAREISTN